MKIEIINNIVDKVRTFREIVESNELIKKSSRTTMMAYFDKEDILGKQFGPRGYKEDEISAVVRQIKESQRVKIIGIDGNDSVIDTVWIINRKK